MNHKAFWLERLTETRARVYLLWMILVPLGFIATQYHQQSNINILWIIISVIGLGYMFRVMPLRDRRMKRIYLAWLVPITLGIIISVGAFYVSSASAGQLIGYLASFWLLVMAVGYFCNGLVDPPSMWYWVAVVLNLVGALLTYKVTSFAIHQYLWAALITSVSMGGLWLFRSAA